MTDYKIILKEDIKWNKISLEWEKESYLEDSDIWERRIVTNLVIVQDGKIKKWFYPFQWMEALQVYKLYRDSIKEEVYG